MLPARTQRKQSSRSSSATETQRHREDGVETTEFGSRVTPGALANGVVVRRSRRISCSAPLCVSVSLWLILSVFSVPSVSAQPRLTFTKDIAPIIWSRCATCHRPRAIGPFSLLTYDDVKRRVTQIAAVTERRVMPPWKPVAGKGDFLNERRLTDAELDALQRWIAEGAAEGEPADLPPPPTF